MSNVVPINSDVEFFRDVIECRPVENALSGMPRNFQVKLDCGHEFVMGTRAGDAPVKVLCLYCKFPGDAA